MDFFKFLIVLVIVVLFILVLPWLSGIGSYSIQKAAVSNKKTPDSRREKLKNKLDKSVALNFSLKDKNDESDGKSSHVSKRGEFDIDSKTGLKRRVLSRYDKDPNNFDFDIDELIDEDRKEEAKEEQQRIKKFGGKSSEAYEGFV